MIVYFTDRNLKVQGTASTELNSYYAITDDKKTETVSGGVVIFEVEIAFKPEARLEIESLCEVGNYVLRSSGDEAEFYTIIEASTDTLNNTLTLYCEDAGLDLLNATAEAYEADQAYPISHYLNKWALGSGFAIGLNECETLTRKLKWDGSSTVTERLASIATQFDNAEISYSFVIEGMRVDKMLINIHKKRGSYTGKELRLDRDINRITKKKSITEIATALQATGSTPSGANSPITLRGYSYDDGDCYVENGLLKSRSAVARWGRVKAVDKNIIRSYSYETESQSELCNRAVTELKKRSDAALTLELDIVRLPEGIKIGDYVNVIDDAGELYVCSRILKLETSVTRDSITAELGDYVVKDSGISEQIIALAEQFKRTAKDGEDAITIVINSTNGTIFKNVAINTTLTAMVFKGTAEVADISSLGVIKWYKDGAYVASGKTLSVNDSGEIVTYTAQLEDLANAIKAAGQISLARVSDGQDGQNGQDGYTPQKGVDYFDGQNGQDGQDGARGHSEIIAVRSTPPSYTESYWNNTWMNYTSNYWIVDNASDYQAGDIIVVKGKVSDRDNIECLSYGTVTSVNTTNNRVYYKPKAVIYGQKGEDGEDGQNGRGVASVTKYYYLSTSSETPTGGSWTATEPDYVEGRYYWSKQVTTYTDGSSTETEPKLDDALNKIYDVERTTNQNIDNAKTIIDAAWQEAIRNESNARVQSVASVNEFINRRTMLGDGRNLTQVMSWSDSEGLDIKATPTDGSNVNNPARLNLTGDRGVMVFAEGASTPAAVFGQNGITAPRVATPLLLLGPYSLEYNATDDSLYLKHNG